jgi:hypothetical protein
MRDVDRFYFEPVHDEIQASDGFQRSERLHLIVPEARADTHVSGDYECRRVLRRPSNSPPNAKSRVFRRLPMRYLTLVLLLALTASVAADNDATPLLTKYSCTGTSASGNYKADLTLVQKGNTYFLTWVNTTNQGMGFRHGNYLVVAFVDTRIGGVGVSQYEITADKLVGRWTGGNGEIYAEVCTPNVIRV